MGKGIPQETIERIRAQVDIVQLISEYLTLIRAHGAKTMHHTCGSVDEIIPDMIGCSLDILQSVQPEAMNMGLADLMLEFGDRICFQGGP